MTTGSEPAPTKRRIARNSRSRFIPNETNSLTLNLWSRIIAALHPWHRHEYPGKTKLSRELLETSTAYAHNIASGKVAMPPDRAIMLATKLEAKALELQALAAECKEHARARERFRRGHALPNIARARDLTK